MRGEWVAQIGAREQRASSSGEIRHTLLSIPRLHEGVPCGVPYRDGGRL